MVDIVVSVTPLDAKRQAVDRRVLRAGDAHYLAVAYVKIKGAAHTAVGAGRPHLFHLVWPPEPQAHLVIERADGAVGHTLPAALAAGIQHRLVGAGDKLGLKATAGKVPDITVLDLSAGAHAAPADDALVPIHKDKRVCIRISLVGVLTGFEEKINPLPILRKSLLINGIYVGSCEMQKQLHNWLEANRIHPVIDRVFEFNQVKEAYAYMKSGRHTGKIVIRCC